MKKTTIGIDPDTQTSGVAICVDGKIVSIEKMSFVQLMDFFANLELGVKVYIENVEAHSKVYKRPKTNAAAMLKIGMNVGMVKATYRHLVSLAEHYDVDIVSVPPLGLSNPIARRAKGDAKYFSQITGYTGRTNEDMRDAGLIAFFYK